MEGAHLKTLEMLNPDGCRAGPLIFQITQVNENTILKKKKRKTTQIFMMLVYLK